MCFDWLVTGGILAGNPATSVRGPKHVIKRGKTPVLTTDQARLLIESIDTSTLVGLRDRALIGVMQLGSHLGNVGLFLPLLGNRGAADAANPAGVAPGRYLAMTVGSSVAMAPSGSRAQTSSIPKSGIPR